jgi:hypothetical protein
MHYLAKGLSRPIGVFLGQDKPNKAKANRGQKDTRRTFKDKSSKKSRSGYISGKHSGRIYI